MCDLFDKKDMLTIATADQAVIGAKGFFGNGLYTLTESVKQGDVKTLSNVNTTETSCFKDSDEGYYIFFLPLDKVNYKKPTFRPLKNLNELFAFMMPDYTDVEYTTDEMIDILMGQHYALKDKANNTIRHHVVSSLSIRTDGTIHLDFLDLISLFEEYEYRKGDKFVPFGVEE